MAKRTPLAQVYNEMHGLIVSVLLHPFPVVRQHDLFSRLAVALRGVEAWRFESTAVLRGGGIPITSSGRCLKFSQGDLEAALGFIEQARVPEREPD